MTQLIFCSICCEPYHPYCVGDDVLMASFVVLACLSKKNGTVSANGVTDRCYAESKGNAKLASSLTSHQEPMNEEALKLQEKLTSWTCNRCTICAFCGKNRRDSGKNKHRFDEDKFVKCSCCKDTYHTQCLGKRLADGLIEDFDAPPDSDDESEKQWLCDNCAKCRSCGVKLDRSSYEKKKKKKNNLMLCLECFKRRQRGSFCPICNVSYDDNDYETRMMECGKCQRWIHAKCEGISEEQYQVLSSLPESIEFVCKLCDETGFPLWLHAIRTEIVSGCESVLRRFVKKALRETRKRRALNFDKVLCLELDNSQDSKSVAKIPKTDLAEENQHPKKGLEGFIEPMDVTASNKDHVMPAIPLAKVAPVSQGSTTETIGLAVKFAPTGSRVTRRSRRKNISGSCKSIGNVSPNPEPIQVYETSDGSLISIMECKVLVQDVLKNSTSGASKYVSVMKKLSFDNCSILDTVDSCLEASPGSCNSKPSNNYDSGFGTSPGTGLKPSQSDLEICQRENLEITPKKINSLACSGIKTPIGSTPHVPSTPSRKVVEFSDLVKKQVDMDTTPSVIYFQEESLLIMGEYFVEEDDNRLKQLRDEFVRAVKEVFSWFNPEAIANSDLPKFQRRLTPLMDQTSHINETNTVFPSTNPFEDTYWSDITVDNRICSFCGSSGDLLPDGCGRLLWAGLNEWIHVNCALWSSEVWEEETGALQQVGQALSRSKNSQCEYCGKTGASVSCCHSSCHKSYHFPCSLKAKCGLKLDKKVFCMDHSRSIPHSSLQLEYQVQRKVFVDLDYIKKKEKPVMSGEVRVYIGSMKIETLGEVVSISVCPDPSNIHSKFNDTILIPNDYQCTRLYWSHINPFNKCTYEISGSVQKDWFRNFALNNSHDDFNIVIDHSEPYPLMREKILQMNNFHKWISTAPKLIDEFNVEWIPQFIPQTSEVYCNESSQMEQCCNVECQTFEEKLCNEFSSIPDDVCLQWERFRDDIAKSSMFPLCDEPFELEEYIWLYERLKDISNLLDEDLQNLDSGVDVDCKVNIFNNPERLKMSFSPHSFVDNFVEKLGVKAETAMDPHFKQMLIYNMLDGAVNDSSSDASTSSSSSSSSSDPEMDDGTSDSSSESEEEAERDHTTVSRRLTRTQTQATETAYKGLPIHPSGRLLRRREKKPEIFCKTCKKVFPSKASLSKHGRWCKLKNSSKGNKKESDLHVQQKPSSLSPTSTTKRSRGRPSKKSKLESTKNPANKETHKRTTRQTSNLGKHVSKTAESSKEDFSCVDKENSSSSSSRSESDEQSKTCPRCHLVYKTVDSLKVHQTSGNCLSSDDDEFSEGDAVRDTTQVLLSSHEIDSSTGSSSPQNLSAVTANTSECREIFDENSLPLQISDQISTSSASSDEEDKSDPEANPIMSLDVTGDASKDTMDWTTNATTPQDSRNSMDEEPQVGQADCNADSLASNVQSPLVAQQEIDNVAVSLDDLEQIDETVSISRSSVAEVIDVVIAPALDHPEQPSHVSATASHQFPACTLNQSPIEFFQSYPDVSHNESQNSSLRPYEANYFNNMGNFVIQQAFSNDPRKIVEPTNYSSFSPVSEMPIPVHDHNAKLPLQTLPLGESSSQLSTGNLEMSAEYRMLPKMQSGMAEGFLTRDNAYSMNPVNYTGVSVTPNPADFISFGTSESTGVHSPYQQIMDSGPPVHVPVEYSHVPNPQYPHSIELQQSHVPSSKMFSWPVSDPSQNPLIVNNNLHQFQQQYDHLFSIQNQMRIPQNHHGIASTQVQSSLQHMNMCTPLVAEGVDHSPRISQGFPILGSTRPATGIDNNMAVIVVQNGNTYSTIPVSNLPHIGSSAHSQQNHSNLVLPENQKVQQNVCMMINSHSLPQPPAQQVVNIYPSDQPSNMNSQSVEPSYLIQQEIPSAVSPLKPYSCMRSCSCGKGHDQCISANTAPFASVQMNPLGSACCSTAQGPKQHLRPVKPVKQLMRQNKPISSRPPECLQSNILPPLFTSPRKRDVCSSNLVGVVSLGCGSNSLESTTLGKVPMSSPNIAVVRPMENPLQKMSNQVAQIEVNFNSPSAVVPLNQTETSRFALSPFEERILDSISPLPNESLCKDRQTMAEISSKFVAVVEQANLESRLCEPVQKDNILPKEAEVSNQDSTNKPEGDSKGKSIKVTLKRKEGGDSYSINDIRETGVESAGAMRSLKIKAKITSGEQAGTATDVVVTPVIQTIPIVSELKTTNGQQSSIGYDEKQGLVCTITVPGQSDQVNDVSSNIQSSLPLTGEGFKHTRQLTHRAVIVYEVKCNDTVLFRSSDVRAVWGHIFEVVQGTRLKQKLPPLPYPATNISLPENRREAANSFNMLGLTHQAVQFLLEQLPGTNSVMEKHKFKFHHPKSEEETLPPANPSGCARTEPFISRKPFDMFGWLASKHRTVPATIETPTDWARQDLPIAMRYRNLRVKSSSTLGVFYSAIHGRGLFTRRDIQEGEMIIEYAGELIRTILSDLKEKYYESRGIGCYFFTIDENVIIDATMKGNAARFINHSCEPNCKSKAVDILGKKHILIFAERKIYGGEELTYDYKFALEDFDKKIPLAKSGRVRKATARPFAVLALRKCLYFSIQVEIQQRAFGFGLNSHASPEEEEGSNEMKNKNPRRLSRSASEGLEEERESERESSPAHPAARHKKSNPPPVRKSSRGRSSRSSRNEGDDEESDSRSGSSGGSNSSENGDREENDRIEGEDENGDDMEERPIWEMFKDFVVDTRTKEHKKRNTLIQAIKTYQNKAEQPLRAELFAVVKSYVGSKKERMRSLVNELNVDFDDVVQTKSYFSKTENLKYGTLRVVKYMMDTLEKKHIFGFMCFLNLEVAFENRESIEWSAFELKKSENAPNHKFDVAPDDSPMEHAKIEGIRHQIRRSLRRNLRLKHGNDNVYVHTSLKEKFIFASVMSVKRTLASRGKHNTKLKCSTIVLAFNPKLPYICFHGKFVLQELLDIIHSIPGDYLFLRNMNLKDNGLNPIYTSLCKVSSASIMLSSTFKRRLEEEEGLEEQLNIRELPAFHHNSKRRRTLKNLIDDKQDGGFKTLSLQYTQSKAPDFPITFKFKAPDGNMDGLIADLFERRSWTNPTPYLKAKDLKTNFLKLQHVAMGTKINERH
ncbi:unnamed protein product [Allacma fusca]|nr:unnamed protein product [Allacma fusca]